MWGEGRSGEGGREGSRAVGDQLWTLTPHAPYVSPRFPTPAGMGEQELDSDEDYSRAGRVNAMLARR